MRQHSPNCEDCDGTGTVWVPCCGPEDDCEDQLECHCIDDMPDEMCAACRALDFSLAV